MTSRRLQIAIGVLAAGTFYSCPAEGAALAENAGHDINLRQIEAILARG